MVGITVYNVIIYQLITKEPHPLFVLKQRQNNSKITLGQMTNMETCRITSDNHGPQNGGRQHQGVSPFIINTSSTAMVLNHQPWSYTVFTGKSSLVTPNDPICLRWLWLCWMPTLRSIVHRERNYHNHDTKDIDCTEYITIQYPISF